MKSDAKESALEARQVAMKKKANQQNQINLDKMKKK